MTTKIPPVLIVLLILIVVNLALIDYKLFVSTNAGTQASPDMVSYLPTNTNNNTNSNVQSNDGAQSNVVSSINAAPVNLRNLLAPPSPSLESDTFNDNGEEIEAYWAPSICTNTISTVILLPTWRGLSRIEEETADRLAKECHNVLAMNFYNKDTQISSRKDAANASNKLKKTPGLLVGRIQSAIDHAKAKENVDASKISLIGYSFGGGAALEYLCNGKEKINGIIGFYSKVDAACTKEKLANSGAEIQLHMGGKDPFVTKESISAFRNMAAEAGAPLDYNEYPDAYNSFTVSDAGSNTQSGVAYNVEADKESWTKTLDFLKRISE